MFTFIQSEILVCVVSFLLLSNNVGEHFLSVHYMPGSNHIPSADEDSKPREVKLLPPRHTFPHVTQVTRGRVQIQNGAGKLHIMLRDYTANVSSVKFLTYALHTVQLHFSDFLL